jgi:hypothetical protein
VTLAALEVLATFATLPDVLPPDAALLIASISQPISKSIEIVARMSSQKKNENIYPGFT